MPASSLTTMPELTITEFARMGGNARAKKLGKKRCKQIAQAAAVKRWGRKRAHGTTDTRL